MVTVEAIPIVVKNNEEHDEENEAHENGNSEENEAHETGDNDESHNNNNENTSDIIIYADDNTPTTSA